MLIVSIRVKRSANMALDPLGFAAFDRFASRRRFWPHPPKVQSSMLKTILSTLTRSIQGVCDLFKRRPGDLGAPGSSRLRLSRPSSRR